MSVDLCEREKVDKSWEQKKEEPFQLEKPKDPTK